MSIPEDLERLLTLPREKAAEELTTLWKSALSGPKALAKYKDDANRPFSYDAVLPSFVTKNLPDAATGRGQEMRRIIAATGGGALLGGGAGLLHSLINRKKEKERGWTGYLSDVARDTLFGGLVGGAGLGTLGMLPSIANMGKPEDPVDTNRKALDAILKTPVVPPGGGPDHSSWWNNALGLSRVPGTGEIAVGDTIANWLLSPAKPLTRGYATDSNVLGEAWEGGNPLSMYTGLLKDAPLSTAAATAALGLPLSRVIGGIRNPNYHRIRELLANFASGSKDVKEGLPDSVRHMAEGLRGIAGQLRGQTYPTRLGRMLHTTPLEKFYRWLGTQSRAWTPLGSGQPISPLPKDLAKLIGAESIQAAGAEKLTNALEAVVASDPRAAKIPAFKNLGALAKELRTSGAAALEKFPGAYGDADIALKNLLSTVKQKGKPSALETAFKELESFTEGGKFAPGRLNIATTSGDLRELARAYKPPAGSPGLIARAFKGNPLVPATLLTYALGSRLSRIGERQGLEQGLNLANDSALYDTPAAKKMRSLVDSSLFRTPNQQAAMSSGANP